MYGTRNSLNALLLSGLFFSGSCVAAQQTDVLMGHNDTDRSGSNPNESILTLATVNAQDFGSVGFFKTDGVVDAQPLLVSGLAVAGKIHNVLLVETEHDSVYAMDSVSGDVLWKTSLLQPGETTSDDRNCGQIAPEIGITSTPVIDRSKGPHGAIFVVGMLKDSKGYYHQRISALDLTTGKQLFGGPTEISASYPGTGDNSVGGKVLFDPAKYSERVSLLEWQGGIYTAWTSHCDSRPYTGWVISYDASSLKQTSVLNLTPNGTEGAVWMGGGGLAATPTKILFLDGNGTFDADLDSRGFPGHQDFGNGFIELAKSSSGDLQVNDYYATDNTVQQSNADTDLGSGGVILFPSLFDKNGNQHQLAAGAGKDGNIYVVNRNDMGKYHSNGGSVYQVLTRALPNGEWSTPAYFGEQLYYGGVSDNLKAFKFEDAKLLTTPVSRTAETFGYPGTTPSISSLQGKSRIVWAVQHTSPAVLFAFNAEDLSEKLYDSNQSGARDQFGDVDKFISQTVVNGRVYVPTQTGVAVFGLLPK